MSVNDVTITVCAYDGSSDHTSVVCPNVDYGGNYRKWPPLDKISCAYCLRVGHWAPACPRERNVDLQ